MNFEKDSLGKWKGKIKRGNYNEKEEVLLHLWLFSKIRDVGDRETRISYNNSCAKIGE